MTKFLTSISLAVLGCVLLSGCADTKTDNGQAAALDHDGHDHGDHDGHDHGDSGDHDHGDHAHDVHGPFGGHTFAFDADDYRGEWKHYNDNDVIRIYVLDSTGKEPAPVKADVSIFPMVGSDKTPFVLEAEKPDDEGRSAVYSLDEEQLRIATTLGVKVEMKTGDKTYTAIIDAHEPHDH